MLKRLWYRLTFLHEDGTGHVWRHWRLPDDHFCGWPRCLCIGRQCEVCGKKQVLSYGTEKVR